jgi:N-acetylneuraminic acid mutarotase
MSHLLCKALRTMTSIVLLAVAGPPLLAQQTDVVLPELPQGIASFGAAKLGDHVYVYSGHTGKTHVYSHETASKGFFRISVTSGGKWESLPMERPAQGLALVATETELFRIGGMHAVNEPGKPHDLHSLSEVSAFDPITTTWRKLPDLPEPRSSHRAAVHGQHIYVFGGWSLNGGEEGTWLDHGLVLDLKNEAAGWTAVTQPTPVRALEVIEFQNRIWLIGGLTLDGEISKKIHIFDPSTETWSPGPDVPGMPANGNGIAAAVVGGSLVLAGMDGKVYRLNAKSESWSESARLPASRIHHRLIGDLDRLLVIAGASRAGHSKSAEFVSLPQAK